MSMGLATAIKLQAIERWAIEQENSIASLVARVEKLEAACFFAKKALAVSRGASDVKSAAEYIEESERFLEKARLVDSIDSPRRRQAYATEAQAFATLALVAATRGHAMSSEATLAESGRSRRASPAVVDGEASLPGSASAAADEPGETPYRTALERIATPLSEPQWCPCGGRFTNNRDENGLRCDSCDKYLVDGLRADIARQALCPRGGVSPSGKDEPGETP